MAKALIVGCGGIGYRHLQALSSHPDFDEIHVLEPREERLKECTSGALKPETRARLIPHSDWETAPSKTDFIVSAVTANAQPGLALKLASLQASATLLEKLLAQSAQDLARLEQAFSGRPVFVNCAMPVWSGYEKLAPRLAAIPPWHMEVHGPNWGLACNAIHYIDLFRHMSQTQTLEATDVALLREPYPSKRGVQFEEFSGSLGFRSDRGHTLEIACARASGVSPFVTLSFSLANQAVPKILLLIDEFGSRIHAIDPEWLDLGGDLGAQAVSQMTGQIWDRLSNKHMATPTLGAPTLAQSMVSHRALFQALELGTGRDRFRIT